MPHALLNPLPSNLKTMPMSVRRALLRDMWNADINPQVFVDMVRQLGYALAGRWDFDTGMPMLVALH